jgi:hypothetical protein
VDCTGPSACLAAGSSDQGTLAERWDGSTWTVDPTPNAPGGGQLFGVACPAPTACTAIGFTFTSGGGELLAEHWNGSSWSIEPTPLIPAAHDMGLPAIACPSTASCTAVGGYENDGPDSVTLAEQWRGGDASSTTPPKPRRPQLPARANRHSWWRSAPDEQCNLHRRGCASESRAQCASQRRACGQGRSGAMPCRWPVRRA